MAIHFASPDELLQDYVNVYFYYDQPEAISAQTIAVTGQQFLWAILEGTVHITHPLKSDFDAPPIGMIGHFTHACQVEQTYPSRAAAISFKPFACHALFGYDMHRFSNYFMDISDTGAGNGNLHQALCAGRDIAEIKTLFDEWLIAAMRRKVYDTTLVQQIVGMMYHRKGNITVEEILHQFSITERTLQRWFNKVIGINPKLYLRIVRFNEVISQLELSSTPLKHIIYTTGYFDQSHFIKDFVQFTGCNPSVFKQSFQNEVSRETVTAILKSMH